MTFIKHLGCALLVCASSWAHALDIQPYSASALASAQQAGKSVALHFRADWCPTCRAQDKVLDSLKSEPELKLTVLSVNFDTDKAVQKQFAVKAQSTLVVLKGQKEVARLAGDTSRKSIHSALKAAL
jgi:thioredoxin 1